MKNRTQPSPTISTATLADLSGYARSTLYDFASRKVLPAPADDQWPTAATIRALIKYLREGKDADAYRTARTRRMEAQADREHLKADAERGKFISKEVIGPALRNLSLNQRFCLERKLESELAARIPKEFHPQLSAAVDEICAAFHNGVRAWMDEATPPVPPPPIAPRKLSEKNDIVLPKESRPRSPKPPPPA
jgi:hypothetical protein